MRLIISAYLEESRLYSWSWCSNIVPLFGSPLFEKLLLPLRNDGNLSCIVSSTVDGPTRCRGAGARCRATPCLRREMISWLNVRIYTFCNSNSSKKRAGISHVLGWSPSCYCLVFALLNVSNTPLCNMTMRSRYDLGLQVTFLFSWFLWWRSRCAPNELT